MKSPDLCPALTWEWKRLSKLIRACVGLRYVRLGCGLPKEKQANKEMIYTGKKDYHNKQQMNELLIIQSWEEIITLFKETSMLK